MAGRRWLRQMLGRLGRDQRGNAAMVFGLCALPLAAGAGLAIDTMLAYSVEDSLQKSLDAAGLAAGRTALPENVEADARSYFNTNFGSAPGLAEFDAEDLDIEVNEVGDELVLSATATMPTRFMRLFGHDTVTVAATTRINRQTRGLELALVLDITGSMVEENKIGDLKTAARELIDILYGNRETSPDLWLSIVPYTGVVNVGTAHQSFLAASDRVNTSPADFAPDGWAGCVLARAAPRDQTDDPPSVQRFSSYLHPDRPRPPYPQYFDNNFGLPLNPPTRKYHAYDNGVRYWEGYGPNQLCPDPITPLTAEKSRIIDVINGLQPWHKFRGATHTNIGVVWGWRTISPRWQGLWSGSPATLPLDYSSPNMDKAIIVLTDGDNTMSTTSVNGQTVSRYTAYPSLAALGVSSGSAAVSRLNTRTTAVCNAVKASGITIYAITFGSTPTQVGQDLMRSCASRAAYYWHTVDGTDLRTAFRTIGTQLSKLRIAQ